MYTQLTTNARQLTEGLKRSQDAMTESARNVWLASVGAVATVDKEASGLFQELVAKGRKTETARRKELDRQIRRVQTETENRLEDLSQRIERAVAQTLQKMGVPSREEIGTLTTRVERLTRLVAQLERESDPDRKVYHVSPHEQGWQVIAEDASRATSVHPTKDEALTAARELARNQEPSKVTVFRMDGTVQTHYTYGDDAQG